MAEKPASRSDAEIVVVRTNDAALPTRSPNADPETVDMRLLRTIASIVPADLPPISQLGLETTLAAMADATKAAIRSEEHTSELQSLMRISYAVFCLKKKKK